MTATPPSRLPKLPRHRGAWRLSSAQRRSWATLVGVVLGLTVDVSPVHSPVLDRLWCATLVGLAGYLATSAKRGPLLVAAIVALVSAGNPTAVACGVVAVLMGAMSTRRLHRRAPFARGLCGAFALTGALFASRDLHPVSAAATLAAVAIAITASGYPRASRRARLVLSRTVVVACILAVLGGALAGLGVLQSQRSVDVATAQLRLGLSAARHGDAEAADGHLTQATSNIDRAQERIDVWGGLGRIVPGVAQHVAGLSEVLDKVGAASAQAASTAQAADVDALTVRRGRIDTVAIAELSSPLHRVEQALGRVVDEVDDHSSSLLLPALDDRLRALREEAARAGREASLGAQAADVFPDLLGGESGPKHYLVLFTSPAEARGRFGFPGSFALVTFDDGRFHLGEHGNTSEAFAGFPDDTGDLDVPDDDVLRPYYDLGVAREMRSVTIPPDFRTVAELAAALWERSGRVPLDGVLRFSPESLAKLMELTGPVEVPTVPEPLDFTNLVSFINRDQYVQFANANSPRREVLDTVSEVTFERLENADLPSPRRLADLFSPLVLAGHLQVLSLDDPGASYFHRAQLDGAFEPGTRDTVMVTNVNSTANKIDTFLERTITYRAEVDDEGTLEGHLTVALHNAAPSSGLPLYVIGSLTEPPVPRGTNRTTLFVYTAVPAVEITVDGEPVRIRSQRTGGRWIHQMVLDLPPGGTRTVDLHLEGDVPIDDGRYALTVTPGGGANPDKYEISVAPARGSGVSYNGDLERPTNLG